MPLSSDRVSISLGPVRLDGDKAVAADVVAKLNQVLGGFTIDYVKFDPTSTPPLPRPAFGNLLYNQHPASLVRVPYAIPELYVDIAVGLGIRLAVTPPKGNEALSSWVEINGDHVTLCGAVRFGDAWVIESHSITRRSSD